MGKKGDVKLFVNGRRIDGRTEEELRDVKMKMDVISRSDGSAQVSFGNTVAIASVYGPRELFPKFLQESDTGILRTRYNMAPFSVVDRKSPGHDRRSTEISKVIRLALEPNLFLEDFPKAVVDVFVEIIQADGSTRVTGINAASIALAAAGVQMKDLVAACSVGKADGKLVADLCGLEDNFGEADLAMAASGEWVTLLQMDGTLTKEELMTLLKLAKNSCQKIYEMQKKTLRESFKG